MPTALPGRWWSAPDPDPPDARLQSRPDGDRPSYDRAVNDPRRHLEEVAARLEAHDGDRAEEAKALHAEVRKAIDSPDDHEGLAERLTSEAIEFEAAHPDLAEILRRAASLLGGAGL